MSNIGFAWLVSQLPSQSCAFSQSACLSVLLLGHASWQVFTDQHPWPSGVPAKS